MSCRRPYFRSAERVDALRRQLALWSDARWQHAGNHPNEMRCGITGDCLFWVHVFKAIGALPPQIQIPRYRKMEAAADKMKLLRERIEATGRAELVFVATKHLRGYDASVGTSAAFMPGDVLLFRNGMSGVHCGLVTRSAPTHFVHLSHNGLLEEPLAQDHWLRDLASVYRLTEPEASIVGHQPSSSRA